jgi:hypothetical protein
MNPAKVEKWHGIFSRLFAGISERAEKSAVSKEIQGRINDVSKKFNKESDGSIPYGLKIEWVKEKARDAFVKDNEVVIRMRNHKNKAENFTYATLAYLSVGCLPNARPYIDDDILTSIDFTLAKKIFIKEHQENSLHFFNEEIFKNKTKQNPPIKEYSNTMSKLDNVGLFTRLLLKEFLMMGDNIHPQLPSQKMKDETKKFVKILDDLMAKQKGEDISPTLNGDYIKSSVVLIAKYETFWSKGVQPYISYIDGCVKKGINTFYLLGRGNNVIPTTFVANSLENDGRFIKVYEDKYTLPFKKGKLSSGVIKIFKTK